MEKEQAQNSQYNFDEGESWKTYTTQLHDLL